MSPARTPASKPRQPWPGPRPYTEDLADTFLGRDRELAALQDQLESQRLSVLTAMSACGKTSLLQAGLAPALRRSRLREARPDEDLGLEGRATSGFPIVLNQWTARAGSGSDVSFASFALAQMEASLESSRQRYDLASAESRAEAAAIEKAVVSVRQADAALRQGTGLPDDAWLAAIDGCVSAFGTVTIILDQFEEVLLDRDLGADALRVIELTFSTRRSHVRQMISMRDDFVRLLRPLEKRGVLEGKRYTSILPMSASQVASIVSGVSAKIGVSWDQTRGARGMTALERLIVDFETASGDVNVLGLQVALQWLFRDPTRTEPLSIEDLETYEELMSGEDLAAASLKSWLDRALGTPAGQEIGWVPVRTDDDPYDAAEIKRMVARVSHWLVSPAGTKRAITLSDFERLAYLEEQDPSLDDERELAPGMLSPKAVRAELHRTCDEAVRRLLAGYIIKRQPLANGDISLELVHDGFAEPLRSWAQSFTERPEYFIGTAYPQHVRSVSWPGSPLSEQIRRLSLSSIAWIGCVVTDVDFSGMSFKSCSFKRTVFRSCTFASAEFTDCEMQGVVFERDCSLDKVVFDGSTCLDGAHIVGASKVRATRFAPGHGMEQIELGDADLISCTFAGTASGMLDMRNAQIQKCRFGGVTTFERVDLGGATLGPQGDATDPTPAPMQPGDIIITGCDLVGAELTSLHFGSSSLTVSGSSLRGAVFIDMTFDSRETGLSLAFDDVDLTGSVMIACRLATAAFRGPSSDSESVHGGPKTPARTLVIRSADWQECVLDNVSFTSYDLENFSLLDCVIAGPVSFSACALSGGTIAADQDVQPKSSRIGGRMSFEDVSDLTALELRGLDFSDSTLSVTDCIAASLYACECRFPLVDEGWRVHFKGCTMPGAFFDRCLLHSLGIEGTDKHSRATALIVRGGGPEDTLGDCSFTSVEMENFTFEKLTIDGPLTFKDCRMSGGTIAGVPEAEGEPHEHLRIAAPLVFASGCELDALEISSVQFDGGSLAARDSACRGMLLLDVDAASATDAPCLDFEECDLSGTVVLDSRISGLRLHGSTSKGARTPAHALTIRAGSEIGNATFTEYDLDGLVLQDVLVTGPTVFERCSLMRPLLSRVSGTSAAASLDVRDAHMHLAQVEPEGLLGAEPTAESSDSRLVRMTPEQWRAAVAANASLWEEARGNR